MTIENGLSSPPVITGNYHRLRLVIVGSVFLLLVSLIVFSVWDGFEDYQEIIKNVEGQSKSYARALKEHAERTFSEVDLVIQTAIQQIETRGGLNKLHQADLEKLVITLSSDIPQIGSLAVADATGRMISLSIPSPDELPSVADRKYFKHHKNNRSRALFISPPFKSRITGKWRFALSRRITTPSGRFAGVVIATIEISYFENLYLSVVANKNGRFSLASTDGDYLVLVPSTEEVYKNAKKTAAFFRKMVKTTPAQTYHNKRSNIANEYRIVSYNRLDKYPVVAIMSFGRDEAVAEWRSSAIKRGLTIGVLGLLIIILSRMLLQQLKLLDQKVQERTSQLSLSNRFLVKEIQDRRQIEENLLEHQQQMGKMAIEISLAEDRERSRIAGELHDQVGQRLILCKIKLDGLASDIIDSESLQTVIELEKLVEQSLQDIRSLTFQLRPPMLSSAGLLASLQWLGAELQRDYDMLVLFETGQYSTSMKHLRYEIRSVLFYATRELLLNVIKHAGVHSTQVTLLRKADLLEISVTDTGSGFSIDQIQKLSPNGGGFGLNNLRQKLEYLGGTLTIDSQPGRGAKVTISLPLHEGLLEE
jgi:signal transduction histidine kinase